MSIMAIQMVLDNLHFSLMSLQFSICILPQVMKIILAMTLMNVDYCTDWTSWWSCLLAVMRMAVQWVHMHYHYQKIHQLLHHHYHYYHHHRKQALTTRPSSAVLLHLSLLPLGINVLQTVHAGYLLLDTREFSDWHSLHAVLRSFLWCHMLDLLWHQQCRFVQHCLNKATVACLARTTLDLDSIGHS